MKSTERELSMFEVRSFTASNVNDVGRKLILLGIERSQVINMETTTDLYCKVFYWAQAI